MSASDKGRIRELESRVDELEEALLETVRRRDGGGSLLYWALRPRYEGGREIEPPSHAIPTRGPLAGVYRRVRDRIGSEA